MFSANLLENAKKSRDILEAFLEHLSLKQRREFQASIHLRPTKTGVTVVSTMGIAPMRGRSMNADDELNSMLQNLQGAVNAKNDDKALEVLKELKFNERNAKSLREEDIQAFLIRDMVLFPEKYNGIQFITSELNLFTYEEIQRKTERVDVLGYKDGVLYDIELKNRRDTSTIGQAAGYVDHLNKHLDEYLKYLTEFPNYRLGRVEKVKGIALVPDAAKSNGSLEDKSRNAGIELWLFKHGFSVKTDGSGVPATM